MSGGTEGVLLSAVGWLNAHVSIFWKLHTHLLKHHYSPRMARCAQVYCTSFIWHSLIGCSSVDQSQCSTTLPSFIKSIKFAPSFCRSMRCWAARSGDNQTVINRMMLRFRPIAPKPVGDESTSGTAEKNRTDLTGRRVKRKYVRVRGRQSKRCAQSKVMDGGRPSSPPEKSGVEDAPPPEEGSVTLQLLRGRSESERKICDISVPRSEENGLNHGVRYTAVAEYGGRPVDLKCGGSVVETWIIMERMIDKFAGVGLGFSDKEKIYNLERDTCPAFVSDWTNNVIWVNPAYKKMVAEDEAAEAAVEKGFVVRLVVKEEIPHLWPSFACRVRVTQQKGQGQKWNKIVPCDVWRMESGGFAWKLDVNTALSLGF